MQDRKQIYWDEKLNLYILKYGESVLDLSIKKLISGLLLSSVKTFSIKSYCSNRNICRNNIL